MTSAQVSLSSADALTPVIRELVLRPSGQRKMDEAWTFFGRSDEAAENGNHYEIRWNN